VLSPIDGRVADINRRVENARASTESSLDAYARSAAEASSYIGVELRRIHDLLQGFGETSFEEYYQMRLAQAAVLPLQQLDESLAQRIIVEVPFAVSALSRLRPGARILDVGSADSTFALSAAALGYQVTAIDSHRLTHSHPNLDNRASSLEDKDVRSDPFAAAFLITTKGHRSSVERVRALVSSGGLFVLTVPYSAVDRSELEAIHEHESLVTGPDWEILERRVAIRREPLVWQASDDVEPGSRGVVMLIASPRGDADLTGAQQ
jgi:hypothetical protein